MIVAGFWPLSIAVLIADSLVRESRLWSIGDLEFFDGVGPAVIDIRIDFGFGVETSAFASGDQDHAVGAERTVDGGGVGILQDLDIFDIRRVDIGQRIGLFLVADTGLDRVRIADEHAVDDIEGVHGGIDGIIPTNAGQWMSPPGTPELAVT